MRWTAIRSVAYAVLGAGLLIAEECQERQSPLMVGAALVAMGLLPAAAVVDLWRGQGSTGRRRRR